VSNPSESLPADWVIWIVIALAFITIVNAVGNIFQLILKHIYI
jgi:hypothetical protein